MKIWELNIHQSCDVMMMIVKNVQNRSKFIHRVFELKDEIAIFLAENHKNEASSFCNDSFILKLAYLYEIFKILSDLNKSMLGPQMHALIQKDKVTAFIH